MKKVGQKQANYDTAILRHTRCAGRSKNLGAHIATESHTAPLFLPRPAVASLILEEMTTFILHPLECHYRSLLSLCADLLQVMSEVQYRLVLSNKSVTWAGTY
jgi:hypothetical protein